RLQPAEDRRDGAQARRAGPGAVPVPDARHAIQHRDPQVHEHAQGAAAARRHRRDQVERPEELPLDHGLAAELPGRGEDLRAAPPQGKAEREDRGPLPERRLRQGLPQGHQGRPGRQGEEHDRRRGVLRGGRSDGRFADRAAAAVGRGRVLQHHHAEVRGAGDPQGLRHRLEADAFPEQRLHVGRFGAHARRAGEVRRPDLDRLHQGPDRQAVAERRRGGEVARVHEEVLPRRQPHRQLEHVRLYRRENPAPGAAAVRRQPDARERDAAGGEHEGLRDRHAAAGHHDFDQQPGFRAHPVGAADALQRHQLGALWAGLEQPVNYPPRGGVMHGLMMDQPLLISELIRHADRHHGSIEIVSKTLEGGVHRYTYRDAHRRARRLANALKKLGVRMHDRVATLAWNGFRHYEIYYAVAGSGAVIHTINPRLFPDQVAYIANHAEDRIVFYDTTFAP